MTDNEIIAEFMDGVTFDESGQCTDPERKYSWRPGVYDPLRVEHLQYDTNWSWLMPVVEKIESLGHYVMIGTGDVEIGNDDVPVSVSYEDGDTKIKLVYLAVIEFINFYNTQKKES